MARKPPRRQRQKVDPNTRARIAAPTVTFGQRFASATQALELARANGGERRVQRRAALDLDHRHYAAAPHREVDLHALHLQAEA